MGSTFDGLSGIGQVLGLRRADTCGQQLNGKAVQTGALVDEGFKKYIGEHEKNGGELPVLLPKRG